MSEIGKPPKHKTTHQNGGADEIDATGLAGRCDFVDRGDPSAVDFTETSLTTDGTWRDLDLSAIVGAGAKAVLLSVRITDNQTATEFSFRKNGNSNTINISKLNTQVANLPFYLDVIVPLDANGKIEYMGSNTPFSDISITVRGWWI